MSQAIGIGVDRARTRARCERAAYALEKKLRIDALFGTGGKHPHSNWPAVDETLRHQAP